jgi:cytochrome c-type biogenesis protein CcmH
MIAFALACALMLLVSFVLLARPLLKSADGESRSRRVSVFVLTSLSVGLLVSALYIGNTNWPWQSGVPEQSVATSAADSAAIEELLDKTKAQPDNLDAWLELGRTYVASGNYASAGTAYQRAYEISKGQNVDAITGLAEALVLTDPSSMNGHAAVLIEEALRLQPNYPKALWYGGLVALQMENLAVARDRFKALLALNPPQQVRTLLERQILDISQQLNEPAAVPATVNSSARKIVVRVRLAAALKQQLKQPISLFVLARNPQQPGPPLAVERHQSSELPLQVDLTTDDAMLPTRTLADAQEVEIVARLSASGAPTEQSGDLFGSATYSFARQGEQGSVTIEIDQRVP